jgi:uncharacterized membrane protein YfcA
MPLAISTFEEVTASGLIGLALVYFLSYLIKGTVGVGGLTPAILFGTYLLGPHHAVLVALTTNALAQVQFIPQGFRDGDWKAVSKIIAANFPCAAIGIWIFGRLEGSSLSLVLGLTLGALVLLDPSDRLSSRLGGMKFGSSLTLYVLAGASGLISGVAGGGGLFFLVIYLRYLCKDPRTLRGTTLLLGVVLVAWRVSILAFTGFISLGILKESLFLLPVTFLGGLVGTRLYKSLSAERFYQFFKIVLVLAAIGLIHKGLRSQIGACS